LRAAFLRPIAGSETERAATGSRGQHEFRQNLAGTEKLRNILCHFSRSPVTARLIMPVLPEPNLPDETLISEIELPTRIWNAFARVGFRTVGDVRRAPDSDLRSLRNIGPLSFSEIRKTLGRAARGSAYR